MLTRRNYREIARPCIPSCQCVTCASNRKARFSFILVTKKDPENLILTDKVHFSADRPLDRQTPFATTIGIEKYQAHWCMFILQIIRKILKNREFEEKKFQYCFCHGPPFSWNLWSIYVVDGAGEEGKYFALTPQKFFFFLSRFKVFFQQ